MTGNPQQIGVGDLIVNQPYRPNPYYFLADRKTWVSVSIVLLLFSYVLSAHSISVSAGYQAGARWAYWWMLCALLSVPIVLHVLLPWLERSQGRFVVARCFSNGDDWQFRWSPTQHGFNSTPPTQFEALLPLCQHLGLQANAAPRLLALLSEVRAVFDAVNLQAARIAGRAVGDHRHPSIRIVVTDQIGSPYCHALAWGAMTIVFPLGETAVPNSGAVEPPADQCWMIRYLLSHEFSHLLLRDEPIGIFSDARLVAIASTLESSAWSLLALLTSGLLGFRTGRPLSTLVAIILPSVLAVLLVTVPMWRRVLQRVKRFLPAHGPAVVLTLSGFAIAFYFCGLIASRFGILGSTSAVIQSRTWMMACLALFFVEALARLCIYYGRRQIEFIADETAISALAAKGNVDDIRREMIVVLGAVHDDLESAGAHAAPVPIFAVGHNTGFIATGDTGTVSNALATLSRQVEQRGWIRGAFLLRWMKELWRTLLVPLGRTHPTLLERQAVVKNPHLQAEQDPSVPLLFTTLPLTLLPYFLHTLFSDSSSIGPLSIVSILATFMLTPFLSLFYIVARRPTRRQESVSAGVRSVQVGSWEFFMINQSDSPRRSDLTSRFRVQPRTLWERLSTFWHGLPIGKAPAPNAQTAPASVNYLIVPGRPLGFLAEVWLVTRWLLVASLLSSALVALVDGNISVSLFAVFLKASGARLSLIGATLFLTGAFLGVYLLIKFFHLSQWHLYAGTGVAQNLWHQCINLCGAILVALFGGSIVAFSYRFLGASLHLTDAGGWLSELLAPNPLSWQILFAGLAVFLTLALSYSAAICWFPSVPRSLTCPLGHIVPMRPHNVLARPDVDNLPTNETDSSSPDWAWLRCPVCGRAPQAREHLICDEDHEAPTWRPSATGRYLASLITTIPQVLLIYWIWTNSMSLLSTAERCHKMTPWMVLDAKDVKSHEEPTFCAPKMVPVAPESWIPLVNSDHRTQMPENLLTSGLWNIDRILDNLDTAEVATRQHLMWSCKDALIELRSQVAFTQMCVLHPPKEVPTDCVPAKIDQNPELACRCLWANTQTGTEGNEENKPNVLARASAALRLYRSVHRLLHAQHVSKEVCQGEDAKPWNNWHRYVEKELFPRLFLSAIRASQTDPGAYLRSLDQMGSDHYPPPISEACVKIIPEQTKIFQKQQSRDLMRQPDSTVKLPDLPYLDLSCSSIYQAHNDMYCERSSGADKKCNRLEAFRRACQQRFRELFVCLSKPNIIRFQRETEVAIALLTALKHRSGSDDARRLLLNFASAMPLLTTYGTISESIQAMHQTISRAGVDIRASERVNLCNQAGKMQELLDLGKGLMDAHSSLADPRESNKHRQSATQPSDIETEKKLRVKIAVYERKLACALATGQRFQSPTDSSNPEVDQWFSVLACNSEGNAHRISWCRNFETSVQHIEKPSSDRLRVARLCRDLGLETEDQCRQFLQLPNGCKAADLAASHDSVSAEWFDRSFQPLTESDIAPDVLVDHARNTYIQGLRVRLLRCSTNDSKNPENQMLCWHYRALVVEAAQLLQNPRDLKIVSTLEDSLGINIDDIYGIEQQVNQQREQIRKEIETATKQTLARGMDRLCNQSAGDEDLRILLHDLRGLSEQADRVMADAINQFARSFGSLLDRQCQSMVLRDRIACANQTIKEMREHGIPELMQRCLAVGNQPFLIGALVAYPVDGYQNEHGLIKATDVRKLVGQCSGIIQLLTTKDSRNSSTADSANSRADFQQKTGKPASAPGEKDAASSSSNEKPEAIPVTTVTGHKIDQGGSEQRSVLETSTSVSAKTKSAASSPPTSTKETRNSPPLNSSNIGDSHELQEITPPQQDAMQVISDLSQVFKETDVVIPEFMRDLFPGIDAGYRSLRGQ